MVTTQQSPHEQEQPEVVADTQEVDANHEVITDPPPQWLIELSQETFRKLDEAHRQIMELDRKYGR